MQNWAELGTELENTLRLKTRIMAFRRLEKAEELDKIKNVARVNTFFTFCQVPFLVRVNGLTVGITKQDKISDRCSRIHGLREASEKSMQAEATMLATTWFRSPEEGLQQQGDYNRIPVSEAIVLAPLTRQKFEPEVLSIYGNPAQIMMLLCGLQKDKYELFSFNFIGEGACSNSLAQCYVTGKPSVSLLCYGERAFGAVQDEEIAVAILPKDLERAISGIKELSKVGLRYPISFAGPSLDPTPVLARAYPSMAKG